VNDEVAMSELSELEMRVLSELEEAGEEDVVTMMMTVMPPTGQASEVDDMQRALESLVRADLVRMSMDRDTTGRLKALSKDESLSAIADLKSQLRFMGENWVDTRYSGPPFGDPFPYIVDTEAGKEKAFQILEQRGYQWWRRRK
jgi:hypothetical protein